MITRGNLREASNLVDRLDRLETAVRALGRMTFHLHEQEGSGPIRDTELPKPYEGFSALIREMLRDNYTAEQTTIRARLAELGVKA